MMYRADWEDRHGHICVYRGSRQSCMRKAKAKSRQYNIAYMVVEGERGDIGCICYADGWIDYKEGVTS